MNAIDAKLRELERDWGFDEHVEIDDSWGAATMRAYGAYTTLLWVKEQLTEGKEHVTRKDSMELDAGTLRVISLRENSDRMIKLADAQKLVRLLAGAMKNEMVSRGLPLEWSQNSALRLAEKFLDLC